MQFKLEVNRKFIDDKEKKIPKRFVDDAKIKNSKYSMISLLGNMISLIKLEITGMSLFVLKDSQN